ncbi:MAG: hypothetical protein KDC44_13565 [Phaeodactylibacter sp.]|nr:hypothetical protein [Phaeodactylibacter sp.]
MLSIYASTELHAEIRSILQQEDRLEELVQIIDHLSIRPVPNALNCMVQAEGIRSMIDWQNQQAPYLLPEYLPLHPDILLSWCFARLGNYEKVQAYLAKDYPTLYLEFDFINRLNQGLPVDPAELISDYSPFDEYRLMHNQAVVRHYHPQPDPKTIDQARYFYLEALESAPNDEYRAFSAWHFALLLIDLGELEDAIRVLRAAIHFALTEDARIELRYALCQALMQQLHPPYDPDLLEEIKSGLWAVQAHYKAQDRPVEQAFVLTDMGVIANYCESWSESLGYFNQAQTSFEAAELTEMLGQLHYRKGTLLFTWAQQGNPQFFKGAIESYQKALQTFSREAAPEVYAEIQHHLGIIYSEIPDEVKKKGLWAAISASAFQEALDIFRKESHPYEYAMVCNHFGNALTKYPEAKLTDNMEKALFYFQEALSIRSAEAYPLERCLSLLNSLEAHWHLGMPEDRLDEARFQQMVDAAQEVLDISPDENLRALAQDQLDKLEQLKQAYAAS